MVPAFAPLEQGFELIYIDYPGCGKSRAKNGAVSFADTVGGVIDVIGAVCGADPIDVLCHSFGAVVLGAALEANAPINVRKCLLTNSSPHARNLCDVAQSALRSRLSSEDLGLVNEALSRDPGRSGDLANRLLPYYCGRSHDLPAIDIEFFPDIYLALSNSMGQFDFTDAMAKVPKRLYVFGSTDFISPAMFGRALEGHNVAMTILEGGHFLFYDASAAFLDTVTKFFCGGPATS